MIGTAISKLFILAILVALSGCTRQVTEHNILPWFLIKKTYTRFGSFDGVTQTQYYVKYFGFWISLDESMIGATVLNGDTVVVYSDKNGSGLLHKGSLSPIPICGTYPADLSIPPTVEAVDCTTLVYGSTERPKQINFKRIDLTGKTLEDKMIDVEGENRFFDKISPIFYDEHDRPYFLTIQMLPPSKNWNYVHRDCALITIDNGILRPIPEQLDIPESDCDKRENWEKLVKENLLDYNTIREKLKERAINLSPDNSNKEPQRNYRR